MVTLEKSNGKGKKKYQCPSCNKPKRFTKYVDDEGEYIDESVGMCDRSGSCGYHYTPKQYYSDNPIDKPNFNIKPKQPEPKREPSFIPFDIAEKSGYHFGQNNFVQHLFKLFDSDTVNRLVQQYFLGTSKHWEGATIFWQMDRNNNIRTGKIMAYSPLKFNRIKSPYDHLTWVHSVLLKKEIIKDFNLDQCLFGEHLLKNYSGESVGLVESEKSSIVCAGFYPDQLWLATGGKKVNIERAIKVLEGKNVLMFPDKDGVEYWKEKFPFQMMDTSLYNGKPDNYDMADYLIELHG